MIIDAKTVILTLFIITIACCGMLRFVRSFALSIAEENHSALARLDAEDEQVRLKRERAADAAVEGALAKVKPILTTSTSDSRSSPSTPV